MSTINDNKLNRGFIIKSKSEISELFNNGNRISGEIVKTVWLETSLITKSGIFVFVSVPKRLIAKATKRNLIKRRIKEALRLNLHELRAISKKKNIKINIAIVYTSDKIVSYHDIESKIVLSLQRIYSIIDSKENG